MRFIFTFALLFLLFSSAFAHRVQQFVHAASGHPSVWKQLTAVADEHPVRIAFAIKHKNVDLLENLLTTVSDPRSPTFGDYLSFDEVNKLTANPEATRDVVNFLVKHGAHNIEKTHTGDYVKATINAKQAEKLFSASVYHFAHHDNPSIKVQRALSYSVPQQIRHAVEFIGYLTHFPTVRNNKLVKTPMVKINAPGNTFPSLLNKVYNIDSNTVTNTAATQSCFEAGQWISNSDINSFQSQYGLQVQNLAGITGPNYPGNCTDLNQCIESTLDFEYIMAVAQGAPTSYIGIDGADQQPFLDYAIQLSNDPNAPLVNSISYGEVEQQQDPSVIQNFNTQVQKLGVRGITVVVASGDDGVANFPARQDLTKCGFYPSYPAVSPYVTAVGATQGPENSQTEVAETSNNGGGITSGGGFSTLFPTPSYQSSFVSQFLNTSTSLPPTNAFNPQGRGYPDVAFLGHNYETVDNGQNIQGSGTSASAPVFAGMLTLINNARLSAGKSAIGFANPALYHFAQTNPEIFHDVTSGENNCVAGDGTQCCSQGFTAQAGWDPVTGLGSVDFAALKKAFLALP